jgi:ketosteroid isomerase-like protein
MNDRPTKSQSSVFNLSAMPLPKGKDKDGKPATFSGIATHVFERQADNSLKLRLHTFN